MKRPSWLLTVFLLAGMLLTACQSKTPEAVKFTIHMKEYSFTPSDIQVKVGQQVTLELVNDGTLAHELMIGKDVRMVDNHPAGFVTDLFKAAGVEPTISGGSEEMSMDEAAEEGVTMVHLAKTGDTATMTFTVTKAMVGTWEMGCFEQDGVHYTAGMKGTFTVNP